MEMTDSSGSPLVRTSCSFKCDPQVRVLWYCMPSHSVARTLSWYVRVQRVFSVIRHHDLKSRQEWEPDLQDVEVLKGSFHT